MCAVDGAGVACVRWIEVQRFSVCCTDSDVSAAQQLELDYTTKVMSVLTMDDMLSFLDELLTYGRKLDARPTLQKARNDLLEYRRVYGITDELPTDFL